jgi:hypothetical protein
LLIILLTDGPFGRPKKTKRNTHLLLVFPDRINLLEDKKNCKAIPVAGRGGP